MILAARMGPMPKIWVRVVPEASTSASMRSSRSAIFLSSVRMSRSTSEAKRRLRRAEAPPLGRMPRKMRATLSAESVPATPPGRRSRRSPCRRFSALVRSATKSSRLSESRRSTSEAASGSTAASLSLREAASAVARASSSSFLRALPLESRRTRAESLGGTSTTDSPEPASLPARCLPRDHQRSPPPNCARGTVSPSVRGLSSRHSSVGSWHARGARLWLRRPQRRLPRRLVGIDPDQDLHERMHLRFGRSSLPLAREGHSDFGSSAPIPLSSHSARRRHRRDASLEQANPSYGRQEVRERSLYDRHPKSLAALETTKLLSRVKQVGSSPTR